MSTLARRGALPGRMEARRTRLATGVDAWLVGNVSSTLLGFKLPADFLRQHGGSRWRCHDSAWDSEKASGGEDAVQARNVCPMILVTSGRLVRASSE
jgi:hypothetical protein